MGNRIATEKLILDYIKKITKDDFNVNLYKNLFKSLDKKGFDDFMLKLKDGDILNVIVPVGIQDSKITIDNNAKISKELGLPFHQFLDIENKNNSNIPTIGTKFKTYVQIMPFRRAKQTVEKGVSISEDSKHIDLLTGQPSGISASSKISNAETQILIGMGLSSTAKELLVDRADADRSNILLTGIKKYGNIPNDVLDKYGDTTRTSKTLKEYLSGMHLKIDL